MIDSSQGTDKKDSDKILLVIPIVVLTLVFSVVGYVFYLNQINSHRGYNTFKNLEFGTNLTIEVSPHGIYTRKFVESPYHFFTSNYDVFVFWANYHNSTIYYEGNFGSLFWIDKPIPIYYEVPFRWW